MTLQTITAASICFKVPAKAIIGRDRAKSSTRARKAVAYVLRERDCLSYPMIADALGNRNHSMIIQFVREALYLIEHDERFANFVAAQLQLPPTAGPRVRPRPSKKPVAEPPAQHPQTRRWCGQCDRNVAYGEYSACKSRFCSLKVAA